MTYQNNKTIKNIGIFSLIVGLLSIGNNILLVANDSIGAYSTLRETPYYIQTYLLMLLSVILIEQKSFEFNIKNAIPMIKAAVNVAIFHGVIEFALLYL